MHEKTENNLRVLTAFDRQFRGVNNEVRKVRAEPVAAFLASRSTEAELKRTLDQVEPFERRMWWRSRLKGHRLYDGTIYAGQQRSLGSRLTDALMGRDKSHLAQLDRLVAGKV